jgi:hypothetical protein
MPAHLVNMEQMPKCIIHSRNHVHFSIQDSRITTLICLCLLECVRYLTTVYHMQRWQRLQAESSSSIVQSKYREHITKIKSRRTFTHVSSKQHFVAKVPRYSGYGASIINCVKVHYGIRFIHVTQGRNCSKIQRTITNDASPQPSNSFILC